MSWAAGRVRFLSSCCAKRHREGGRGFATALSREELQAASRRWGGVLPAMPNWTALSAVLLPFPHLRHLGPAVVIGVLPLDLQQGLAGSGEARTWLLPALRRHVCGSQLRYWADHLMPLAKEMGQSAAGASQRGNKVRRLCAAFTHVVCVRVACFAAVANCSTAAAIKLCCTVCHIRQACPNSFPSCADAA